MVILHSNNKINPVSANELTSELGFSSVNTTKKYMDYLHEPYLFYYNLVIVTYNDKRTIEKDGYRIDVVPVTEF